jgi:OOP family OmpA-OmpF porin
VKNTALALVSVAALSVPSIGMAQSTMDSMKSSMTGPDSGWFVGGSVGQSKLNFSCPTGNSCDDTDTAFRVFGGYNFNKYFGAELGYADFGKATFSTAGLSGEAKAAAWDVMAVGTLPIGDKFGVYGKLGWYRADTKSTGIVGASSDTNSDFTMAVGGQFNFNKNLGMRAEWQQYNKVGNENRHGDVDVISVGVVWAFK